MLRLRKDRGVLESCTYLWWRVLLLPLFLWLPALNFSFPCLVVVLEQAPGQCCEARVLLGRQGKGEISKGQMVAIAKWVESARVLSNGITDSTMLGWIQTAIHLATVVEVTLTKAEVGLDSRQIRYEPVNEPPSLRIYVSRLETQGGIPNATWQEVDDPMWTRATSTPHHIQINYIRW